jgi:hypothetical protein
VSRDRRIDRLQTELPPPSDPDPAGAAAVPELLGGRFGELSTFMNYTSRSFNFRNRQGARPFYDLVANIAGEEFGHVELVAATINTTRASPRTISPPRTAVFAPDYAPEEIAEIGQKLRARARLPKEPTAEVANGGRRAAARGRSRPKTAARR